MKPNVLSTTLTDQLFDLYPNFVVITNLEGSFIRANAAWEKLLGYPSQELLSRPFLDFVHSADKEDTQKTFSKLLEGNTVEKFVNRYIKASGDVIWLEWSAFLMQKEMQVFATAVDVTEREHYKRLTKDLEREAHIGAWEVYLNEQKVHWSEETYRIHELPLNQEVKLEEAINFYIEEDRKKVELFVNDLIKKNKGYDFKLRIKTAKANIKWVRATGNVELVEGKPYRIYGTFQDITSSRESEIKLRDSLMYHKALVGAFPDALVRVSKHGDYLDATASSPSALAVPPNKLIGKRVHDVIKDKQVLKEYLEKLEQCIKTGRVEIVQYKLSDYETGEIKYFETRLNRISRNEAIAIVRNVTARVKEQEGLEQREKYLSSLVNTQSNYVIRTDMEGRYTFVNETFLKKFGYTYDIIGTPSELTYLTEDHKKCETTVMKCIQNPGKTFHVELKKNIQDSSEIVESTWEFTCITDENGVPKEIQCFGTDLTEIRKTKRELDLLSTVGRETSNAVIITDDRGRIEWINHAFHRLTGYSEKEVVGRKPGEFLQGQKTSKVSIGKLGDAIKNRRYIKERILNYTKEGKEYWVEIEIKPFRNPLTGKEGFIGIQREITGEVVYERTLKRNVQELKKTNQELDNFVYRVSHDLRAPLASAIGLVELSKIEEDPRELQELIRLQGESLERMDGFISDILDYSRNSRVEIKPVEIELEKIFLQTFEELSHFYKNSKLLPDFIIDQQVPFYSDRLRLEIIIKNLISNSIKYQDPKKKSNWLRIEVKVTEDEVNMIFEDNGLGIKTDRLPLIFNMFYRASEASSGSGIGLYIVKESIEKLSGEISVNSQFGGGTLFAVKIPNFKLGSSTK